MIYQDQKKRAGKIRMNKQDITNILLYLITINILDIGIVYKIIITLLLLYSICLEKIGFL